MNWDISVIGIGKLGLCMAACFANKGYSVIGVDINPDMIRAVNEGKSILYEPGLAELVTKSRRQLSATDDYERAIKNSEVTFIVVPTPSDEDGGFSTKYVEVAASNVATHLRHKDDYHLVVLTSTVLPGVTDGILKPLLEEVSGKKCSLDFGLCYNPEFIALGSVIRDFTNPDVVLIGESDSKSGAKLAGIYQAVCNNKPYIARMTTFNAELTKISFNVFATMKMSFANTLAEICERIPGGNIDTVTRALGFESRVGPKLLTGALGYGGPCLPRDNKAFASFAKKLGCDVRLSETTDEVNQYQNHRVVSLVKQKLGTINGKSIAILGLTYKPNTDLVDPSASLEIAKTLSQQGARVKVYDPAGMQNAKQILGQNVEYTSSASECITNVEFCILATPWDEFKRLSPEDFIENMRKPVLLDCWRVFERSKFNKKLEYIAIGIPLGNNSA